MDHRCCSFDFSLFSVTFVPGARYSRWTRGSEQSLDCFPNFSDQIPGQYFSPIREPTKNASHCLSFWKWVERENLCNLIEKKPNWLVCVKLNYKIFSLGFESFSCYDWCLRSFSSYVSLPQLSFVYAWDRIFLFDKY